MNTKRKSLESKFSRRKVLVSEMCFISFQIKIAGRQQWLVMCLRSFPLSSFSGQFITFHKLNFYHHNLYTTKMFIHYIRTFECIDFFERHQHAVKTCHLRWKVRCRCLT